MSILHDIGAWMGWIHRFKPGPVIGPTLEEQIRDLKIANEGQRIELANLRAAARASDTAHAQIEAALTLARDKALSSSAAMAKDLMNAQREWKDAVADMMKINNDNLQLRHELATREEEQRELSEERDGLRTQLVGASKEAAELLRQSITLHHQYEDQSGLGQTPTVPATKASLETALRPIVKTLTPLDSNYRIPTSAAWETFFAGLPDFGPFELDLNDCDDFARKVTDRAKNALPGAAIGYVDCSFIGVQGWSGHRMNLVVWQEDATLKVGFFSYRPTAGGYLDSRYNCPEGVLFEVVPVGLDGTAWVLDRAEV